MMIIMITADMVGNTNTMPNINIMMIMQITLHMSTTAMMNIPSMSIKAMRGIPTMSIIR